MAQPHPSTREWGAGRGAGLSWDPGWGLQGPPHPCKSTEPSAPGLTGQVQGATCRAPRPLGARAPSGGKRRHHIPLSSLRVVSNQGGAGRGDPVGPQRPLRAQLGLAVLEG